MHRYRPILPAGMPPEQLQRWMYEELVKLAAVVNRDHLEVQNEAPAKPRDGDLAYADGTNWNPGSGEGIYAYYNATWNKL